MEGAQDQTLASNRQIKCDVCNVWCCGIISYQTHITGRPHYIAIQKQKGVDFRPGIGNGNGTDGGPPSKKARKSDGPKQVGKRCEICDISTSGQDAYEAHIKGARHLKKIKENEIAPDADTQPHIVELPGGKGYRCAVCKVDMSGKVVVLAHLKGAKHIRRLNSPVPPSADSGEAEKPRNNEQFECKICHKFMNTLAMLQVHEASAKHKHKVELAAKIAAEVAPKPSELAGARLEANVGPQLDAWDPHH